MRSEVGGFLSESWEKTVSNLVDVHARTPDDTSWLERGTISKALRIQRVRAKALQKLLRMSDRPLLAVAPGSVVSSALATSALQNARAADVGAPKEILPLFQRLQSQVSEVPTDARVIFRPVMEGFLH